MPTSITSHWIQSLGASKTKLSLEIWVSKRYHYLYYYEEGVWGLEKGWGREMAAKWLWYF